jgi:hypothetical protein
MARYLIARWGEPLMVRAHQIARHNDKEALLQRRLVYAYPLRFGFRRNTWNATAKSLAVRMMNERPLTEYFHKRQAYLALL